MRAVLDTCVLYPAALRDVLLRCAENGLFEPRWSQTILDELVQAIARRRPDIEIERLERLCNLMNEAFPEASVEVTGPLLVAASLPDPNDGHVLRAAVVSLADVLVTLNSRDFPPDAIALAGVPRVSLPDEFLLHLLEADAESVLDAVECAAADMRRPRASLGELLDMLTLATPDFAAACRSRFGLT